MSEISQEKIASINALTEALYACFAGMWIFRNHKEGLQNLASQLRKTGAELGNHNKGHSQQLFMKLAIHADNAAMAASITAGQRQDEAAP